MRKRFWNVLGLVTLLGVFSSVTVFAQPHHAGKTDTLKVHASRKSDSMKAHAFCKGDSVKKHACCMGDSIKKRAFCKSDSMKARACCKGDSAKQHACCMGDSAKKHACAKFDSLHKRGECKADSAKKGTCPKMQGKAQTSQKTCPVSGQPVDKSVYTDYKGKRVYFCCAACKEKFLKSPEEYLKKKK